MGSADGLGADDMTTDTPKKAKPHQQYYLGSGQQVVGVTTALNVIHKGALVPWANRLGLQGIKTTEYVDEMATIGTLAHEMIAHHLGGAEPDLDDYTPNQVSLAENACLSYYEWEKGKEMVTVLVEAQLVSEGFEYGGTIDWYGTVDGVPTLVDLKTSKALYDDHVYQLAAYHNLLVENGHEVETARLLQVGRSEDEGFSERVYPGDSIEPYFNVFLNALGLYNAIRTTKRRK